MTASTLTIMMASFLLVSILFTEALKKLLPNKIPNNLISLLAAVIVGGGGTVCICQILGFPSMVPLSILMSFVIWVGSMAGYDKVWQTIKQIEEMSKNEETPEHIEETPSQK